MLRMYCIYCTLAMFLVTETGFSVITDRVTNANYERVSRRLLEYYSLSDAEAKKRRERSMSIDEMIKDTRRKAKQALKKSEISFDLNTSQRTAASYESMRTLNFYRNEPELLYSLMETADDLEFFSTQNGGLFKVLDKTDTATGSLVLASMLLNPLVTKAKIDLRNNMLRALLENKSLRDKLKEQILEYKKVEDAVLSFWSFDSNLNVTIDKNLYWKDESQNTESNLNMFFSWLPYIKGAAATVGVLAGGFAAYQSGLAAVGRGVMTKIPDKGIGAGERGLFLGNTAMGAFFSLMVGKWWNDSRNVDKDYRHLISLVRTRGIALGTFFQVVKNLDDLVDDQQVIADGLKNSALFAEFKGDADAYDDNFKDITHSLLNDDVYKGAPGGPGPNMGLVLVNDRKIRSTLSSFSRMFELLGEIDAYLSVIELLEQKPVKNIKFSIPDPIAENLDPRLIINEFWHPMIKKDRIVTNDIKMDDGFRGIILTGSNTGGKSTALKGMILSTLMGQSWGICPCSSMNYTPFSFIGSFMNITDNIAEKASLFQAEVDRAKNLIHVGKDVARSEGFGLVVMDELFTGTNPEKGEKGTNFVANKLFLNTRLITLFATHYKRMTEIPKNRFGDQVRNYKIDVAPHPEKKGRFVHTFKMVPGISEVDYADHLFERDL